MNQDDSLDERWDRVMDDLEMDQAYSVTAPLPLRRPRPQGILRTVIATVLVLLVSVLLGRAQPSR